jgi:hypothetical protein
MAYFFGAGNNDVINMAGIGSAPTFSVFARFALTQAVAASRCFAMIEDLSVYGLLFKTAASGSQRMAMAFTFSGGLSNVVRWDSGFTAGTIHTLAGTYDGATLSLYADVDATAKATVAETHTPILNGSQAFLIGNDLLSPGDSADATIYEIAWWPSTVLTGAQCAQLGGGDATGIPLPGNYWDLIADPGDLFGGHNGVVTGAIVAPHSGKNLWPLGSAAKQRGEQ